MGAILIKLASIVPLSLQRVLFAGFIFILSEGCNCYKYCYNSEVGYETMMLVDKETDLSSRPELICTEYCSIIELGPLQYARIANFSSKSSKSTSAAPLNDSVAAVGNPVPKKSAPGQIAEPLPGEYFATTITLGPSLNFKSSNEDYGGGYGEHEPGVGLNIGVGTVLPFDKHWAIAPSLRFTQKNASEKLGYSVPGGGGGMDYTDKYSYSYIGAPILAQYRAGKHLSFVAGPEINYLISASVKNDGSNGSGEKQNITNSSQKFGFDLLAGIKYEIPAGNKRSRLGLQLMYDHRLSRLNKKQDDYGNDVPAYNMKSFQLGLAYNICGCGKKK
jgi:hypothetical protein